MLIRQKIIRREDSGTEVEHDRGLHTCELSLHYGRTPAFQDVTLPISTGQVTAIIGPSGSGKTSFLMCLNRLTDFIPHAHVSGSIRLGGLNLLDRQVDVIQLRRRIGMIFQKPTPFPLSIRRNLELPLREHGVRNAAEIENRIESALRDVGLWDEVKDRLHGPALALSGGQQQRLCLARALILQPEVLLLDEPCSALDPMATEVIERLLTRLRGRLTMVVVTHNLAQARRVADRIAFFWLNHGAGCLVEHGSTDEIFQTPQSSLTEAYVHGRMG